MQKILSARLEEAAIAELERVTRKRAISKRRFLEEAIYLHARNLTHQDEQDIWTETLGAWRRRERAAATIRDTRRAFQKALERHHRKRHARVRR